MKRKSKQEPRFLVTAGNTREAIDSVRDWGNIFTGNTGFEIAKSLSKLGKVDLLTSNTQHRDSIARSKSRQIAATGFKSHAELLGAISKKMKQAKYTGIFMTAAVADYKPVATFAVDSRRQADGKTQVWTVRNVQAGKVKSSHKAIAVLGEPTEKIIDLFRSKWKHAGLLVKFKLEVGVDEKTLIEIAKASRATSGADFLVANTLEMVRGRNPGAFIVSADAVHWVARKDLAQRLRNIAREYQETPHHRVAR